MIHLSNHLKTGHLSLRRLLAATLFLALFASGAIYAFAGDDLIVYITTDRDVYGVGDEVKVTYIVDNETDQTIRVEGSSCSPAFKLRVLDIAENELWKPEDCPIICCTCARCPIRIDPRDVPPGETVYENEFIWREVRTLQRPDPPRLCGCVTEQVKPGFYYLVGQVADSVSDPILVEIR